jgi:hypothetical protein
MRGGAWEGLCALRDLRKDVIRGPGAELNEVCRTE